MKFLCMIVVLLAISAAVYPCSIFKYSVDGRTYFCGNEDWTAKDPAIQTYKANGKQYGYVLFGWRTYLPRYAQAGVNSEGLCFDWAAVPTQAYLRDNGKPDASLDVTVDILKNCKSIDEVINYIEGYNVPHIAEEHIIFTDKAGKSCVIEYNHSQLKLIRDHTAFQFITNFHLTDPALGWYPCERYREMEAFFREDGNKERRLAEILDKVHQEGQYPTIYSYIFDLGRMEITVFYNHNYMTKRVFAFSKLVETNEMIDISSDMDLGG